jgi:hypothetical protein
MDVRKYRFTTDSYNAPVMPFCSLTKVLLLLLLIKEPPVILTLLEYWNIVGFKGGLQDFVAVSDLTLLWSFVSKIWRFAFVDVRTEY